MQAHMTLLFLVVALVACTNRLSEKGRLQSPDGEVDAVQAIQETGATVSTPTEIYLVKSGETPYGEPILRADKVEGLEIAWRDASNLLIRAKRARIFRYQKSISVPLDSSRVGVIEISIEVQDLVKP